MKLENKITQFEHEIAKILANLCYHVHPEIVSHIQDANAKDRRYFENLFDGRIELNHYFFEGSACVFPGIRRYVSARGQKSTYSPEDKAILDDNTFPRHLWCFLVKGTAYSPPAWKNSGLSDFELAHVYSHKPSETGIEEQSFREFDECNPPFNNFTCAANVALLPKGTVRPTDNSILIKSVFFKRHIELYGESTLNGRSGFREENLPDWYGSLHWNVPFMPSDWKRNVELLMQYRKDRIEKIMARHDKLKAA